MGRNNASSSSTIRPYSGGRVNSITSQCTRASKKGSNGCRSTVGDQNSTVSSYLRNMPLVTNVPEAGKYRNAKRKATAGSKTASPKSTKRSCRRRKVNTLRQYAANRFGELSKNPFINFFRAYKRKHADMSLVEIASRVAKIWNNMTEKQKVKYQLPPGCAPGPASASSKRAGGGIGAVGGVARGRRPGRAAPTGGGVRKPGMRPLYSRKVMAKDRSSPDMDEMYSDQTVPSSKSGSRTASGTLSLSD